MRVCLVVQLGDDLFNDNRGLLFTWRRREQYCIEMAAFPQLNLSIAGS